MELEIIPKYVDTIIVYNNTKKDKKLIEKAGYTFDEYDECELTMEFYDGIAYDINGTGLIMRYPKMCDLTSGKKKTIIEYTGIDDGTINQHDIALKYGVLELSKNDSDKIVHCTLNEQHMRDETLILMGCDICKKVYDMSDDHMDWNRAARIVRILADEFEKMWEDLSSSEYSSDFDYGQELEIFEANALKRLEREININNKWD